MKRLLLIALSAGLLAQPAQVDAQLYFNGIPDATEYLNFLSGSGVSGGYGVQVGPYVARFETPTSANFSIYCVDYLHYAQDQWVNVTAVNSGNLSNTRLNNALKYRQVSYLASLFDTAPTTNWGGIHAAIWSIASGQTLGTGATATLRDQLLASLTASNAAYNSFSTDGWYILSPQTQPGGQEFLMRTRVSVPEPAGFLLMATGLLMLAAVSRKRFTELQEGDA